MYASYAMSWAMAVTWPQCWTNMKVVFLCYVELKWSPRLGKLFTWPKFACLEKYGVSIQLLVLVYLFLRRLCSWGLDTWQPVLREGKLVCAVCWRSAGSGSLSVVLSDILHRKPVQMSWTEGSVWPIQAMNFGVCSYGEVFQKRDSFHLHPLPGMSETLFVCMGITMYFINYGAECYLVKYLNY